jgi:hypothetical protein
MSTPSSKRTAIVFAILAGLASLPTLLLLGTGTRRLLAGETDRGWTILLASVVPGLFAAAFAAGAWLTVLGRRKESAIADRRARYPGEPWLWASEWEHGRIAADRQRSLAGALLAFAAIWNAATFAAGFLVHQKYGLLRDPAAGLTVLVFATAGLFLLGLAVYQLALVLKYVPVVFEMGSFPGVLGGPVSGTVQLPPNVPAGAETAISLSCVRVSSGSRSSTRTCIWQDETSTHAPATGLLSILFTVPFDLPASTPQGESGTARITWELSVSASVPGVDYSVSFNIPVFATDASDATIRAGAVDVSQATVRPPNAKARIVVSEPSRTVIALKPAKGLGCGVTSLVVAPAIAGLVSHLARFGLEESLTAYAVSLLVGGGILLLSAGGVLLTATQIEIDHEAIRVPHGRRPLTWTRTIPLDRITEVKYASGGNPPTATVDVHTQGGVKYWVSDGLSGLEETKWLAAELTRLIERYRRETTAYPRSRASQSG